MFYFELWVVIGVLVLLLLAAAGTVAYLEITGRSKENIRCDETDGVKIAENGACVAKIKACGNDTTLKDGVCEADTPDKKGKKIGGGEIAGIAIGGVVGAGILAAVVSRVARPEVKDDSEPDYDSDPEYHPFDPTSPPL